MANKYTRRLKRAISIFLREIKTDADSRVPYAGNKYRCPVCTMNISYFNPVDKEYLDLLNNTGYQYPIAQIETFNIGSYYCPNCGVNDRERLYALYFSEKAAKTTTGKKLKMVDFAPSWGIAEFFKRAPTIEYRSADLYMDEVDDKVDITDMKLYNDNSFDIFVCSHVLEHIEDDGKAMSELYRILRPGGWGIAMVPIWTKGDHVIEKLPEVKTEADRWMYYGQGDHVRFYNRAGFVERLGQAGFKVNLLGIDYFGSAVFEQHGIHPRSVLYIVEKL